MRDFGDILRTHRKARWSKEYIDYEGLNALLQKEKESASSSFRGFYTFSSGQVDEYADEPEFEFVSVSKGPTEYFVSEETPLISKERHPKFMRKLKLEVEKVNQFYLRKLHECEARLELQRGLLEVAMGGSSAVQDRKCLSPKAHSMAAETFQDLASAVSCDDDEAIRQQRSLQHAMVKLHKRCRELERFGSLNYTATVKILKRYDRLFPGEPIGNQVLQWVAGLEFHTRENVNGISAEIERNYGDAFAEGDKDVARALLSLEKVHLRGFDFFHFGWRTGIGCGFILWFMWDVIVDSQRAMHATPYNLFKDPLWHLYRACGEMILFLWCWGGLTYIWRRVGVNWVDIMGLDRNYALNYSEVFDEASLCTIFYGANLLLYFKVVRRDTGFADDLDHWVLPLILVLFLAWRQLFPWPQRRTLIYTIGSVLISPFSEVLFQHTFVADVITSMVRVWTDIALTACFFASGDFQLGDSSQSGPDSPSCRSGSITKAVVLPILSVLPLWWRCMQCLHQYGRTGQRWPYLANAFKYALAQSVSLFGIFHPSWTSAGSGALRTVWIVLFLAASLYQFFWDLRMDWGLLQYLDNTAVPQSRHSPILRERLLYNSSESRNLDAIYYVAICADLGLRMTWTLSLIPTDKGDPFGVGLQEYLNPLFAVLEIGRRSMWALFRLEHEHLKLAVHKVDSDGFDTVGEVIKSHTFATFPEDTVKERSRMKSLVESILFGALVVAIAILAACTKE